jgi:hypothetical protein
MVPVEALRTFINKGEDNIINTQITAFFWSICRAEEDEPPDLSAAVVAAAPSHPSSSSSLAGTGDEEQSLQTFQTGGAVRPEVRTTFQGDPVDYMKRSRRSFPTTPLLPNPNLTLTTFSRFEKDVAAYLESMPAIDTNVILGYLPLPLIPSSAYELVGDAMKLDVSARNAIPSTCCIWMGQRMCKISRILDAIVSEDHFSSGNGMQMGVGPSSFHSNEQVRVRSI